MNKVMNKIGIGLIAHVEAWLNHYGLPYDRNQIKRLINFDDKVEAFEVTLKNEPVEVKLGEGSIVPPFITDGKVKITIILKKNGA